MKKAGWQDRFIAAFRECANVRLACDAAGITREYAHQYRKANADFADQWESAEQDAVDLLEKKAWERATAEQSDRMLELLLKAHRPEKYAERLIVLRKIADEVKNAPDDDLLTLLGYEPGTGDQAPVGAGGAAEAGEAAGADGAEE